MAHFLDEFSDESLAEEFPNFAEWAEEEGITIREFLEHILPEDPLDLSEKEEKYGQLLARKLGLPEGATNV